MRRIKFWLLSIVFLIVIIGSAILLLKMLSGNNKYVFNPNSQAVVKQLRELNRLETASFTIEKIIDAKTSGNRFQEILFGDHILLIAHGEVIAGFDLSKLNNESVQISDKNLSLKLPPPQILKVSLDNAKTRVYDRRQGLLTKGDKDLETKARGEAEKEIWEAACQGKILDEASKNARSQLSALFRSLQFSIVNIEIPLASC